MTEQLKFLLILYSGIVLFNVLISAWLFLSNRNRMFGALFVAWMALFLTFLGQGLLRDRLNAAILVGTPTTFLGNLGLCDLLIFALGQHHHVARSLRIFAVGYAVTVMMTLLPVPYWNKTLPVMLGATIPILISITELFSRCPWKTVSNPKRAYAGVLLVLIFHELNSPFTVNRPELAIWGFTITAIIVFAMSIFGPMLAIEATEAETAALKIQHQALERDMEVTLAVQSLLLPKASDYSFNGIDIASFYRSATRAGGDWWWVDQREDGTLVLLLGDVSGHGPDSAMITTLIASSYQTLRKTEPDASAMKVLQTLDWVLTRAAEGRYLMTLSIIELDPKKSEMRWASAGAPPALTRFESQEVQWVGDRSAPLGTPQLKTASGVRTIAAGEKILLFTDGTYELNSLRGRELGLKRWMKLFAQACDKPDLAAMRGKIIEGLESYSAKVPWADDVTFVLVDFKGLSRSFT